MRQLKEKENDFFGSLIKALSSCTKGSQLHWPNRFQNWVNN